MRRQAAIEAQRKAVHEAQVRAYQQAQEQKIAMKAQQCAIFGAKESLASLNNKKRASQLTENNARQALNGYQAKLVRGKKELANATHVNAKLQSELGDLSGILDSAKSVFNQRSTALNNQAKVIADGKQRQADLDKKYQVSVAAYQNALAQMQQAQIALKSQTREVKVAQNKQQALEDGMETSLVVIKGLDEQIESTKVAANERQQYIDVIEKQQIQTKIQIQTVMVLNQEAITGIKQFDKDIAAQNEALSEMSQGNLRYSSYSMPFSYNSGTTQNMSNYCQADKITVSAK